MNVHALKTEAIYWELANNRTKTFEVRQDDRQPRFETGDVVVLVNQGEGKKGQRIVFRIGYLLRDYPIPGYVVFQLDPSTDDDDDVVAAVAVGDIAVSVPQVSR